MNGTIWIILGIIAAAFSLYAIPYGFNLRSIEKNNGNSSINAESYIKSEHQQGGITAQQATINITNGSTQSDGQGGRGGGGNAIGKDSVVLGGRGGKGGSPGGGRGGDGGGGDSIGEGSMVIGGDGGGGGRSDGRGGMGGDSPLKRLSQEKLKSWGLTGNEGYGQGGRGANSAEYDQSLKVLSLLSAEYALQNSNRQMIPMPGVLMPPVEWVNGRLSQMQETFRVELIDNGTDFLLRPMSQQ